MEAWSWKGLLECLAGNKCWQLIHQFAHVHVSPHYGDYTVNGKPDHYQGYTVHKIFKILTSIVYKQPYNTAAYKRTANPIYTYVHFKHIAITYVARTRYWNNKHGIHSYLKVWLCSLNILVGLPFTTSLTLSNPSNGTVTFSICVGEGGSNTDNQKNLSL